MKEFVQQTPVSKRIRLITKEEYAFDLEYSEDFAILHLPYVGKFTRSVYEDMTTTIEDVWEFLSTIHYKELFVGIPQQNATTIKLAKKLGFISLGSHQGVDILQYKEYK